MSEQFKNIQNIGIFWEQEEWGGVDSYLQNLINSSSFENPSETPIIGVEPKNREPGEFTHEAI